MLADPYSTTIEQFTSACPWVVPLLVKLQLFCRTGRTLAEACRDSDIPLEELLALVEEERPAESAG